MKSMEELKIFSRLKKTQDGVDFIAHLADMSKETYDLILSSPKEKRDEIVGQGQCLAGLIKVFETCDEKLARYGERHKMQ